MNNIIQFIGALLGIFFITIFVVSVYGLFIEIVPNANKKVVLVIIISWIISAIGLTILL